MRRRRAALPLALAARVRGAVTADGAASSPCCWPTSARPQHPSWPADGATTARRGSSTSAGGARARRAGWRPAAAPAARRSSAPPGTGSAAAASATATAACSSTTSRPARGRGSSGSRRRGRFTSPRLRHTGRPAQAPRGGGPWRRVALCAVGDRLVSGHQDGRVRGWDARDRDDRPAWTAPRTGAAPGRRGLVRRGAGGRRPRRDVRRGPARLRRRPRAPDAPVHAFREHRDFPYCLATLGGDLIFTGAGDGALLCRDRRGTQPPARCRRGRDADGPRRRCAGGGRSRETGGESRRDSRAGHDVRGAGSCAWGLGAGLSGVRCVDARPAATAEGPRRRDCADGAVCFASPAARPARRLAAVAAALARALRLGGDASRAWPRAISRISVPASRRRGSARHRARRARGARDDDHVAAGARRRGRRATRAHEPRHLAQRGARSFISPACAERRCHETVTVSAATAPS